MNPKTYVDYCLKVTRQASMAEVAQAASAVLKGLHAAFSKHPDKFALAFPHADSASPQKKLSVFRVFADSLDDQGLLNGFVAQHSQYEKLFYAKFPQLVPVDFSGPRRAFVRLRIASRATPIKRHRRMVEVGESGNIWVDMSSKENGQRFRLYVQTLEGSTTEQGKLNSYGLSVKDAPIFLPVL